MNYPTKIAVIGAGGVACQLTPCLALETDLVIVDGDSYEPGNSNRQFPALHSEENKATTLANMLKQNSRQQIDAISTYLKSDMILNNVHFAGVEMIIGAVDNGATRKLICNVAEAADIPAIICGNETEMGEAHLYVPGIYDPFEHFHFEEDPPPYACNSNEQLDSAPQTSQANYLASAAGIHILMSWRTVSKPRYSVCYSRLEAMSSTFKRVKDFPSAEEEEETPAEAAPAVAAEEEVS